MRSQFHNPTREAPAEAERPTDQISQKLLAGGGVIAALAASSCCLVPLALFGLGVSGAWIGNLIRLAPYQPYFIAAAVICLGAGYWLHYRSRKIACEGVVCVRPFTNWIVAIGFGAAAILIVAAVALDLLAPLFLQP